MVDPGQRCDTQNWEAESVTNPCFTGFKIKWPPSVRHLAEAHRVNQDLHGELEAPVPAPGAHHGRFRPWKQLRLRMLSGTTRPGDPGASQARLGNAAASLPSRSVYWPSSRAS